MRVARVAGLVARAAVALAVGASLPARGGGPLASVNHQPVVYIVGGANMTLNIDQGPLGARSNAQAVALVVAAAGLWNGVATSTARFKIVTPLAADYTLANYLNVYSNFSDGLNPVLFDSDGSIVDAIFGAGQKSHVLGVAGSAYFASGALAGRYIEGRVLINGFPTVSDATMTLVIAHELGHFFGLDHTQLDGAQGLASANYPLMYPIAYRTSISLHEDDAAASTSLYPNAAAANAYGRITGTFTTGPGVPVLGANLWAREVNTGKVYSTVSDYLLQNTGYFSLYLPPGNYTLNAESIASGFTGGSSVGPYAEDWLDASFQPPHPIAPIALGGGAGQPFAIVVGCDANATFRVEGTGSVSGNCALATMPGTATIVANPYGAVSVQGGTLVGNTITNLQSNAILQLGNVAGSAGSYAQFDFQGMDVGSGNTLTIRSGASGQTVVLRNAGTGTSTIAGTLQAQGGNGAPAPIVHVQNASGFSVATTGRVSASSGLIVDALGVTWTSGQALVNMGVLDGGASLRVMGANLSGGGVFRGNAIFMGTYGNANNPDNGAHFLANGLQLSPGSGNDVALTLNLYGTAPQFINAKVTGNASVALPSAWPAGTMAPANNLPMLQGGSRAPGMPDPAFGGGSIILQATGSLTLAGGIANDFVFPGGVALKAGGTLDLNAVAVVNGWTTAGKPFQGVYIEAPNIVSGAGNIVVLTNDLNWVNFSTLPHAPVRAWTLVKGNNGSAAYATADAVAPHLNTYSILVEAAAAGQCVICLVNTQPVAMY